MIDLNGGPDLAVATGKGRGGDGMHYWKMDKKNFRYIDLGEGPALMHDKGGNFFTTISSAGKFQFIRYNYDHNASSIRVISGIGLNRYNSSGKYEVTHLNKNSSENEWSYLRCSINVSVN